MTLGSWPGPHPLRNNGNLRKGLGRGHGTLGEKQSLGGSGCGCACAFFFFFSFLEWGRLFIVQRVVSECISFVSITF